MKNKRRSILIAESDRALARVLRLRLERCGFTVYVAHDEEQACILAARQRYDLMITAVGSAAFDGIKFCDYVREELGLAEVPIAVCCPVESGAELVNLIYKYGVSKVLLKPVDPEAIVDFANDTVESFLATV